MEGKYLLKCCDLSPAIYKLSERSYYGSVRSWNDPEKISIGGLKVKVKGDKFRTAQSRLHRSLIGRRQRGLAQGGLMSVTLLNLSDLLVCQEIVSVYTA